jgi:hypothetical protein
MQSHVNARNLPDHGVSALAKIVKKCSSYKLVYSNFADLDNGFTPGVFEQ